MAPRVLELTTVKHAGALLVRRASDQVFPRHYHDEYGMGFIEAGAQRSASGRGQVEAGPGQVITLNPGEIHDGEPAGAASRRWSMIYLAPAAIAEAWRHVDEGSGGDFEFSNPAVEDPLARGLLAGLFRNVAAAMPEPLRYEELLVLLLSRLGCVRPPAAQGTERRVARAKALIDDDPTRALSLADLAAEAGLSRFQTLRAFARVTGLTPHGYLLQRRLLLARSLIIAGEPLPRAAAASGFYDQSHMSRVFRRCYGYTPGRLAKSMR
ncbi:MAG: AraC family transcriptional regulator [Phenylobacterium sp.]